MKTSSKRGRVKLNNVAENKSQYRGPEIDDTESSGYFTGFIGALLGALVGTIPWILVAIFAELYVGWLGFLIGWASLFGYKLLKGVKNRGYALTIILVCSILCILLAQFGMYYYEFFSDPDIAEYAEALDMPKLQFVWEAITLPEVLPDVLKDLAIALVVGIVGVVTAKSQIDAYTGKNLPEETSVPAEQNDQNGQDF